MKQHNVTKITITTNNILLFLLLTVGTKYKL